MHVVFYYVTLPLKGVPPVPLGNESSLKKLPGAAQPQKARGPVQAQRPAPPPGAASTSARHARQKLGKRKYLGGFSPSNSSRKAD